MTSRSRKQSTEQPNKASAKLDTLTALQIARLINGEDAKVAKAVKKALPQIAKAIDLAADALSHGGRLIYVGAGTSGRIAALDASECPPTFNTESWQVQYVIAGGETALGSAIEGKEDSRELGEQDIAGRKPGAGDLVVGIAASGRTPYTVAAVEYARARGAKTVALVCNPGSPLAKAAQLAIVVEVGPEVLTGSSRMKAGTAQKMVLNMISTGAMARLGYVYGNLMVNVHFNNQKLVERGFRIVQQITGLNQARTAQLLHDARNVPTALVMNHARVNRDEAIRRLKRARGNVRKAIEGKDSQSKKKTRKRGGRAGL
ncbi:MAG: N-acetylmuramic acid 6-phosphate etherase [Acidobacteriia bacterium]|nr:N-acetylmuramic acid 6-phosphate etherase [Terriglobia bacterium]